MGFDGDVKCVFCRSSIEDRDHLFFHCGFSKQIGKEILGLCSVSKIQTCWADILKWGEKDLLSDSLENVLCKLSWGPTVYHIWKQRNDIKHSNHIRSEEQMIKHLKWEIRTRVPARGRFQSSLENISVL